MSSGLICRVDITNKIGILDTYYSTMAGPQLWPKIGAKSCGLLAFPTLVLHVPL